MNKTAVILQASYIPWLGYFDQMAHADVFVYLDDVQYTRRDWRNRNYIKNQAAEKQLLSIPVQSKNNYHALIKDIRIATDHKWIKSHLNLLKSSYRKAAYFEEFFPIMDNYFQQTPTLLSTFVMGLNQLIIDYLGIEVEILKSSDLSIPDFKDSTDRLIQICLKVKADHYISGASSANYMKEHYFEENKIQLSYQKYQHPTYQQLGEGFIPYLSVLDLIFNEGPNSLGILKTSRFI